MNTILLLMSEKYNTVISIQIQCVSVCNDKCNTLLVILLLQY